MQYVNAVALQQSAFGGYNWCWCACLQIWTVPLIWRSYGRTTVWCDSCHYHSLRCTYFHFVLPFCQKANNEICSAIKTWTACANRTWSKKSKFNTNLYEFSGVWLLPVIDTVNIWTCFYFPFMSDLQHLCLHARLIWKAENLWK